MKIKYIFRGVIYKYIRNKRLSKTQLVFIIYITWHTWVDHKQDRKVQRQISGSLRKFCGSHHILQIWLSSDVAEVYHNSTQIKLQWRHIWSSTLNQSSIICWLVLRHGIILNWLIQWALMTIQTNVHYQYLSVRTYVSQDSSVGER